MTEVDPRRAIEAVWRMESARLIAGLARFVRDLDLAEELAQEALVAALEQWPGSGVPANPGAWLMTVGKRRAVDLMRRDVRLAQRQETLANELRAQAADASADAGGRGDDLLRLMLVAAHPVVSQDARVALTLRLIGGLETHEIARAFLVSPATIAQRIVRAKRTISEARVPFEVPEGRQLRERLASVLEVVYLIFNEGYSATAGDHWTRPELCRDALRVGRVLAELVPAESEVHGLVALMEIQASRLRARVDRAGRPVLLLDQDRGRWDWLLVRRGLDSLARAERLGAGLGPYALQAAIAAAHARARTAGDTDWTRIAALYDALAQIVPSPVVELNRAVAVGMAFGPAAGLEIVEALNAEGSLASYYLLPSVRGDFFRKLGRFGEAAAEFERAAGLTRNEPERALLLARAGACARSASIT